jgi:hypothetical protein
MKNIMKSLVVLLVLIAMAVSVSATELVLENKDSGWNVVSEDGIYGVLEFDDEGTTFDYEFIAVGLTPSTEYSLIYYADKTDRFVNWGGNDPGALLGTGTADSSGSLILGDTIYLGMNLPSEPDANIDEYDYCESDDYENCHGAKIWLVPTDALPEVYPHPNPEESGWRIPFWNSEVQPKILFETDLITYTFVEPTPAEIVVSGLTDGKVVVNVDYSGLDKDDSVTETLTYEKSLTFENLGTLPGDVSLGLEVILGDYTVEFEETGSDSFTLDGGKSKTVILQIIVPVDEDSGVHEVGTLDVDGVEGFADEDKVAIETSVKSMLKISDLDVIVDDDSEDVDDGEEIEKIAPGMEVELELQYENLFDSDYRHGDLDNVELTVELANLEDDAEDFFGDEDDELDITEDCDDIDADDNDGEITVSFDIPDEAEEESYELVIRLEAEDENGATHVVEWTITLDVDREKDDVRIEKADLAMDTVVSGGETFLRIKLTNYGSNDQDEVALTVFNSVLGIDVKEWDIELEEDPDENSYSKTIPINVDEDVLAGTFTIDVRVFIDGDEEVDHRLIQLMVTSAEDVLEEEEEVSDDDVEVLVQDFSEELVGEGSEMTGATVSTVETSTSKGMTAFMVVVIVLLVILIAVMLGVLIKR